MSCNRYGDKDEGEGGKGELHSCSCDGSASASSVRQTLDEMDFERGIWYAAQQNDLDRIEKLLSKNGPASTNEVDNAGYTALHYAARNGHVNACKILLDNGTNVDSITRSGRATSLHRASTQGHYNVVELLLNANADPNIRDADGYTPLHRAIVSRHFNVCKLLIPRTDINLIDNKGRNHLRLAVESGFDEIVDLFSFK